MASIMISPTNEKKRVKVYELKNNDWFDRGTGFCTGRVVPNNENDEPRILVQSEDEPDRLLLETRIGKDDGYQKQQDTLIVWTEPTGVDMALSFQEAEGCASIWEFVSSIQQQLVSLGPDDALSDDAMETFASNPLVLPQPEIGNLEEIEHAMRTVASTPQGRDALAKFVISEDYIRKLIPLVEMAEDLESLKDLHLLCNIMKMLILLNDSQIVDHIVTEQVVYGVIGALEYDPDFPNHKANHRRYLRDHSRYREVIKIADEAITRKIHGTWRLTYLKDVVLARILDDPTFGVLNSLIFFNQVDIISHLQSNPKYLEELFGIIDAPRADLGRKKDAVGFIQSCCAIAKSLQAPARANLYSTFINHGLLRIITFAVLNREAALRVSGTDILVAMIDHDPSMVRGYILKSISEKKTPLTETLIELLLVESDLGVKAQAADAIKVLLEPAQPSPQQAHAQQQAQAQAQDAMSRNGEVLSKVQRPQPNPQTESYIHHFYEHSARKLFQPLKDLETRNSLDDLTFNDVQLFTHLVEIVMYLSRTHLARSRYYLFSENLISRIAQLLSSPQKHLKLIALKFFRSCIGLQDDEFNGHFIQRNVFTPILEIVYSTMPRDNLLNSACLDLFEFIRHANTKSLIEHIVTVHCSKLQEITYVDTFKSLIEKNQQIQNPPPPQETVPSNDNAVPEGRMVNGGRWGSGVKDLDSIEQAYFENSDEEDEADELHLDEITHGSKMTNGLATPPDPAQPLVDYGPEDEEDELGLTPQPLRSNHTYPKLAPSPIPSTPPERIVEKRRRENDDDDDELGKLATTAKRRNASSGTVPQSSSPTNNNTLKRKKSFFNSRDNTPPSSNDTPPSNNNEPKKKIGISFNLGSTSTPPSTSPSPEADACLEEDELQ